MCIKVDRWFYCQVQGQGPPVPPGREQTNTYEDFWAYWQHGETVGLDEQQYKDLPPLQGYHYVRHKDERWIRCAMTNVTACRQYPLEIRTELYDIPCPECSQDDPCVLSDQPSQTFENPSPNMTSDVLAEIAEAYANEVIALTTSYFRMQLNRQELDEESWDVHQRGLYCTLDKDHIVQDHPLRLEGPVEYPCFADCFCTTRPWAQNSSRAARNQDATQVRVRGMTEWFTYAQEEEDPPEWVSHSFANMPNQFWLVQHEDGTQRYGRLSSQVSLAVAQLGQLGPTIQDGTGREIRFEPSAYHGIIRLGQFTATKLLTYPCLDPGVTAEFLDLLMRNHFLTALCPFLNTNGNEKNWRYVLRCHRRASVEMQELLVQSEQVFMNSIRRVQDYEAMRRHTTLANALERNRWICLSNAIVKNDVAEGFAQSWVTYAAYATTKTKTCHICVEDFDDISRDSDIPPHLRVIETRCCDQFMHARCLKGTVLRREKCPLCNTELKDMGYSIQRFVPDARLMKELHKGCLPGGMIAQPSSRERRHMDNVIDALLEWQEAQILGNDDPWT